MATAKLLSALVLTGMVGLPLSGCDKPTASNAGAANSTVEKTTALAPTRTGFTDVDGGRVHYAVYGDLKSPKTPLLILHGSLMSGEAMMPFVEAFSTDRPVITVDARGHGKTGDLPGPITYPMMADDCAQVIKSLGLLKIDVLGYSMGGTTAVIMAVRHPELVGKQVVVSAPATRNGWQPQVLRSFSQWSPEMFKGSPVEAAYKRLSTSPEEFPTVINESRELEESNYDVAPADLRAIRGKTMIVAGDSDGVDLVQMVRLFEALGGPDPKAATQGYIAEPPKVRFAILPATSHIGMMNQGPLVASIVTPFLDDRAPARPSGFFEGVDAPPSQLQPGKGKR